MTRGKKKHKNVNGAKKGEEEMNEDTKKEKADVKIEVNNKSETKTGNVAKANDNKDSLKKKDIFWACFAVLIIVVMLTAVLIGLRFYLNRSISVAEAIVTETTAAATTEATVPTTEATAATETISAETTAATVSETTAVPETAAEETTIEVVEATGEFSMGWNKIWPWSPFRETTKQLPDELTHEIFAEPGTFPGMNGDQTAWDKMENETTFIQAIEGGGTYISTGGMKLELGGKNDQKIPIINLPFEKSTNYLVFVRGLPADGTDKDLNRTIFASEYVPGHSINHVIPMGAYFSLDWTLDQVQKSFESPNCGEGCHRCVVVVIDLQTRTMRIWEINDPDGSWQRIDL